MPRRFTVTEKWRDSWFRRLNPSAKLLFNYLCDNCDIAGFWEIDLDLASSETGIRKQRIHNAFVDIKKAYRKEGRYIWIINFIFHQGNLPLNPEAPPHKGIIRLLRQHNGDFGNLLKELDKSSEGLCNPISKGKGIGKGKGKYYTLQQCLDIGIQAGVPEKRSKEFFNHYEAQGWVFGNGLPIVNLGAALAKWRNNQFKFNPTADITQPKEGICACGCGKTGKLRVSNDWFYNAEHRKKKLGW